MESFKVAFLIDTSPFNDQKRSYKHYKQVSLTVARILLFLSYCFPKKGKLKWSYKLYSTNANGRSVIGLKTENFFELSSSSLKICFAKLESSMSSEEDQVGSVSSSRVLFEALTSVLYQLPWDTPDIASPKKRSSSRLSSLKKRKVFRNEVREKSSARDRSSFIFILSDCPHSSEDLCTFCCNPLIHTMDDANDAVKKLFLPGDLVLQLTKFNIGLHWVDTKHRNAEQNDWRGMELLSDILSLEGGSVIPISSLTLVEETGHPHTAVGQKGESGSNTSLNYSGDHLYTSQNVSSGCLSRASHPTELEGEGCCPEEGPGDMSRDNMTVCPANIVPPGISLGKCLTSQKVGKEKGQTRPKTIQFSLHKPDGSPVCCVVGSSIGCENRFAQNPQRPLGAEQDSPVGVRSMCEHADRHQTSYSCGVLVGFVPQQCVPLAWIEPCGAFICAGYTHNESFENDECSDKGDSESTRNADKDGVASPKLTARVQSSTSEERLSASGNMKKLSIVVDMLNIPANIPPAVATSAEKKTCHTPPGCRELSIVLDESPLFPRTTTPRGGYLTASPVSGDSPTKQLLQSSDDPKTADVKGLSVDLMLLAAVRRGSGLSASDVYSRRFQALNILMARRCQSAIVGFNTEYSNRVAFAMLQPVSSLRSSLTFITADKEEQIREMLGKMKVKGVLPKADVTPATTPLKSVIPESVELCADLSCLFDGDVSQRAVFDLLKNHIVSLKSISPSFSQCLLPWFRHHPCFGTEQQVVQALKRVQLQTRSRRRKEHMNALKFRAASRAPWTCTSSRDAVENPASDLDGLVSLQDQITTDEGGHTGGQVDTMPHNEDYKPTPCESIPSCDSHVPTVNCLSIQDVVKAFNNFCDQKISSNIEPDDMYRTLHSQMSWLQNELAKFSISLLAFLEENDFLKDARTIKESVAGEPSLHSRLSTQMILQIFLYLEVAGRVPSDVDVEDISEKVAGLCRSMMFSGVHGLVGKLFNNTIIPCYSESCRLLLTSVYDELTWPLPPVLGGDIHSTVIVEDSEDPPEPVPPSSSDMIELDPPKAPASTGSVQTAPVHRYPRSCSFLNKEIPVANKDKKKKLKKNKSLVTKSTEPLEAISTGRCQVKRSLFTRSYSTSVMGSSASPPGSLVRSASSPPLKNRKRRRTTDSSEHNSENIYSTPKRKSHATIAMNITCVKETPVKKQVSNPLKLKMRRARTKSSTRVSPNIVSVSETPKRSKIFYSKFSEENDSQIGRERKGVFLKKNPSPQSLKSLLHGRLAQQKSRRSDDGFDPQVEVLLTDIIEESPTKNSSIHHSEDLGTEDPLILAGTPLKSTSIRQIAFMDTPLKHCPPLGLRTPSSSRSCLIPDTLSTPVKASQSPDLFRNTPLTSYGSLEENSVTMVASEFPKDLESDTQAAFLLSTPPRQQPQDFHGLFANGRFVLANS